MKSCEPYREAISAFVDNEVSVKESQELFRHLGECAACREFLSDVISLRNALRVPLDSESVTPTRQPFWKRTIRLSYSVAAAIALAALLSGYLMFRSIAGEAAVTTRTTTEYVYLSPYPVVYVYGEGPTVRTTN